MRIAFITMNKFPEGDAGSLRQSALAKACLLSGMEVFIVGLGNGVYKKIVSYNGLEYVTLRKPNISKIEKVAFYNNYGKEAISLLLKNNFIPDCIIVTMLFKKAMKQVLKYSKSTKCKIFYDCVEWYSASEFKMRHFDPNYILNNSINKRFISKNWNVISISSYLNDYFLEKGIKSIRLPVIFDLENYSAIYFLKNNSKIVISYVGSPGKKDNLKNILIALSLLNKEQLDKIELRIVGVNKDDLFTNTHIKRGLFNQIAESINIIGCLPHEKAIDVVKNSNYSIIIRDEKERFSKAGFPTKVVESLCCGTPILCNLSSDLGFYLKDNYNSIITDSDPFSIKVSLNRIMNIDYSHYEKLRINSRLTAEKFFNCENYSKIIKEFLEEN